MTDPDPATGPPVPSRRWLPVVTLVVGLAFGIPVGLLLAGGDPEPCHLVQDRLQPYQDRLTAAFGDDAEAARLAAEITAERPDCFDPEMVEFMQRTAEEAEQGSVETDEVEADESD